MRMEPVSGLEVFERIKQLEHELPTIIVTAFLEEERVNLERIANEQIHAVLTKPVDPDQLLEILEQLGDS